MKVQKLKAYIPFDIIAQDKSGEIILVGARRSAPTKIHARK